MGLATRAGRPLAIAGVSLLVLAGCGDSDSGSSGDGDKELVIGTLLPQTGSLATLGPPEFAAVDLAIKEINDAGGVFGKNVVVKHSDSGDTKSNIATQSVERLIGEDADAIVGAASSSVSLNVLTKVTDNGLLMFSPANTSNELTTADTAGLYFRTAPPDKLQGKVLAEEIKADGHKKLGILALQDSYGTGLADRVEEVFKAGGGEVVAKEIYDPAAPNFTTEVGKVKAANADAYLVIAFDETVRILPEMQRQAIGPKQKAVYFTDGNLSNGYKETLPAGLLTGVQGSIPGAQAAQEFRDRVKSMNNALTDFSYSAEAYDATVMTALAAMVADSDEGEDMAGKMEELSKGGEKCTSFSACKTLLDQDKSKDIDYDGVSGPVEFNGDGDPTTATINIFSYRADNTYDPAKPDKSVTGTIDQ